MQNILFIVILFLVAVVIYNLIFGEESDDNMDGIEKYFSFYDWNGRCLSPYCERQSWWYNRYTPFIWNNSGRYPRWWNPPYTYLTNYYRDYYRDYYYPTYTTYY